MDREAPPAKTASIRGAATIGEHGNQACSPPWSPTQQADEKQAASE